MTCVKADRFSILVRSGLVMALAIDVVCAQSTDLELPRAVVDRSEVQVADQFILTVSIVAPAGTRVVFPELVESLGDFHVVRSADQFNVPEDDQRRWTRIYTLESWESGALEIPAMYLTVAGQTVTTDPVPIKVKSSVEPQADPLQFRDLKELEEIEPDSRASMWLGLAIVGLSALGLLAWFLMKRRPRELAPDAWAYAQLGEVESSSAYRQGDRAATLPPLADILREYIQRRFGVAAPKQTTTEFLTSIQADDRLTEPRRAELQRLLAEVDQIKFASLRPDNAELNETFERVRSFVRETTLTMTTDRPDKPTAEVVG